VRYELYYWPTIQGRGEFLRLALEEAGADYVDVARRPGKRGVPAMMRLIDGRRIKCPPFAPPFLKAGKRVIGQTANILLYLGARHGLAPKDEDGRLWANQLQLTIADLVTEAHDTHHPIASALYYEEQRPEAKRRSADFWKRRVPKYLGYFENVIARSGGPYLLGRRLGYVDLSLFQIVEGLRYAFPKRMKRFEKKVPRVIALHDRVAKRPRVAAYLASDRRIPFNEWGIFRRYRELDR
jgi:glutathione S-transferase